MHRKTLLLIAPLWLVCAADARAQSICFQADSGGGVLIAKGAQVPPKGVCTPVALVEEVTTSPGRAGLATGSICRDSFDGTSLVYQYTYTACTGPGGYFESATCGISLGLEGQLPQQPSEKNGACNGVFAVLEGSTVGNPKTAPLTQFTELSLRVWNCPPPPTTITQRPNGACIGIHAIGPMRGHTMPGGPKQ